MKQKDLDCPLVAVCTQLLTPSSMILDWQSVSPVCLHTDQIMTSAEYGGVRCRMWCCVWETVTVGQSESYMINHPVVQRFHSHKCSRCEVELLDRISLLGWYSSTALSFFLSSGCNYQPDQSLCRYILTSLNDCHYNMTLSCPSSPQQSHLAAPPSPFSPLKICLLCPSHANQPQAGIKVFKYI